MKKKQGTIIVIGAGAAGLMAAYTLASAGRKVIILEARERIGGRVFPLSEKEFGYPAQGGAEFIHGEAPITRALIEEASIHVQEEGEWWSAVDGEPKMFEHSNIPDPVLLEKLQLLKADISIAEFFDTYLPAAAHDDLRKKTYRRIEGYFAGDPARTSAFALRDEMEADHTDGGGGNTPFKEGYGALLEYLAQKCKGAGVEIILNTNVISVRYENERVEVACANGERYEGEKVIIALPVSLIPHLTYVPPLPAAAAAAQDIGFGDVIKILCTFKTRWWEHAQGKDLSRMYFMLSNKHIPTWWTTPDPRPVLTGWLAGPKATTLSLKDDKEIEELALTSLAGIFGVPKDAISKEVEHIRIIKWPLDPYAKGAYSYPTPTSAEAIQKLRQPIENTLFFAGEALSLYEITGTVEAALASGKEVAERIIAL